MGNDVFPIFVSAGWIAFAMVVARVVVNQFLRREVKRSLAMLGAGVVLAMLVAVLAPIGLSRLAMAWPASRWEDWHAERAAGVSLGMRPFRVHRWGKPTDNVWLYANLEVKGMEGDLMVTGGPRARQTWRWPDGYTLTRDSAWVSAGDNWQALRRLLHTGEQRRDAETDAYWKRRREELEAKQSTEQRARQAYPLPPVRAGVTVTSEVLPSTPERMRRTPPSYEATVPLALLRPEVWVDTPLTAGGWYARGGYGFRLGRVAEGEQSRWRTDGYDGAKMLEMQPTVFTEPVYVWEMGRRSDWRDGDWRTPQLLVVNRATGDVEWQYLPRTVSATIASVSVVRIGLNVWRPLVRRGDKWQIRDEHWLEGASVVFLGTCEEARFTRTVKTERFETDVPP
jgi:hypothetical protein